MFLISVLVGIDQAPQVEKLDVSSACVFCSLRVSAGSAHTHSAASRVGFWNSDMVVWDPLGAPCWGRVPGPLQSREARVT